jgi:hypothetical protein
MRTAGTRAPWCSPCALRPTFKWSEASGALTSELRVFKGGRLLLKKTGTTDYAVPAHRLSVPKKPRLKADVFYLYPTAYTPLHVTRSSARSTTPA